MAFFSYFISGIKSIFLYTIKFIKYFLRDLSAIASYASRGPAVARSPPRLNSLSKPLPSRILPELVRINLK